MPHNLCTLCGSDRCTTPELETDFKDDIWYLNLGGTTRYADVAGRTKSKSMHEVRRNPIYFNGNNAVMHLGAESGATNDDGDRFLLFDRQHIHRVVAEIKRGNSVSAESYSRKPRHELEHVHDVGKHVNSHAPESRARARWCKPTLTGKSLLFHRWLLLTSPEEESCFKCIEHLNDLALDLDCRETNLLKSKTVDGNNKQIHLLKRSFWHGGCTEAGSAAEAMQVLQQPYWKVVQSAPLLPDCVFRKKRVVSGKRKRNAKSIPSMHKRTNVHEPIVIL